MRKYAMHLVPFSHGYDRMFSQCDDFRVTHRYSILYPLYNIPTLPEKRCNRYGMRNAVDDVLPRSNIQVGGNASEFFASNDTAL